MTMPISLVSLLSHPSLDAFLVCNMKNCKVALYIQTLKNTYISLLITILHLVSSQPGLTMKTCDKII